MLIKIKILKCFTGPQGFVMGEADLMRSRDLGEKFECKSTSDETFQYLYYYMRNFCYLIGLVRAVVFQLDLKYLHVKITNLFRVVV